MRCDVSMASRSRLAASSRAKYSSSAPDGLFRLMGCLSSCSQHAHGVSSTERGGMKGAAPRPQLTSSRVVGSAGLFSVGLLSVDLLSGGLLSGDLLSGTLPSTFPMYSRAMVAPEPLGFSS